MMSMFLVVMRFRLCSLLEGRIDLFVVMKVVVFGKLGIDGVEKMLFVSMRWLKWIVLLLVVIF